MPDQGAARPDYTAALRRLGRAMCDFIQTTGVGASPAAAEAGDGPFTPFTPLNVARRFVGLKEVEGAAHNPQIVAMLRLSRPGAKTDELPWCSGFASYCAWLAGYERSRSLRARSWLRVGEAVEDAGDIRPGDVVILSRGRGRQPGPEVIAAPGHVGFVAETPDPTGRTIQVLGGNQGNRVSVKAFPASRVLGVRRLRRADG